MPPRQWNTVTQAVTWLIIYASLQATPSLAREDARGEISRDNLVQAVQEHLEKCDRMYADVDAKVAKADTHFAGYHPVSGFPYLRTDRLMASYADELHSRARVGNWLFQLRDNEGFSRRVELVNLGMPPNERSVLLNDLRLCAVWQSYQAFFDPDVRGELLSAVQPPGWADTTLAYPPVPDHGDERKLLFGVPRMLADLFGFTDREGTLPATLWKPNQDEPSPTPAEVRAHLADAPRDALGRIGLTPSGWRKLARFYAPSLLITTAGDRDEPGTPVAADRGIRLDRSQATIYYQPDFARVSQAILMQFNYFIWFASAGDATALDGLIWRVTLDPRGRPLAYESLRMDGGDHQWFPTSDLTPKGDVEPKLRRPVAENAGPLAVHIKAKSHDIDRVMPASRTGRTEIKRYKLKRYEALFTLKVPGGGRRNLFDSNGSVRGGRAGDDGIPPRQYRHHPLAPNEPWFFDNPRLLENVFELPARLRATVANADQKSGK